jgi:hypothetical protein
MQAGCSKGSAILPCAVELSVLMATAEAYSAQHSRNVVPFSCAQHRWPAALLSLLTMAKLLACQPGVQSTTAEAPWFAQGSPSVVTVPAVLCFQVGYGEQFKIVGNEKELGSWDASKALELKWHEGDVWAATAELPVAKDIEFKASTHWLARSACEIGSCHICAHADNLRMHLHAPTQGRREGGFLCRPTCTKGAVVHLRACVVVHLRSCS